MAGLWDKLRSSGLWRILRCVAPFRSVVYFCIELKRTYTKPEPPDADFERSLDPWQYESSALELDRFRRQLALLAGVGESFGKVLEIGCAEGRFTELLAPLAGQLRVLDISSLALKRTQQRRYWGTSVHFEQGDLRTSRLASDYDLIVVTGVLEYFPRAATLRQVTEKLAGALKPDGHLLVESTRAAEPAENSWWWRLMPRGRRINQVVGESRALRKAAEDLTPEFAITLFRKAA